ncbi:hypothetical protein BCI9360_03024 [Bacillus sp. CECT 9360]|nr:hypothetical protein BCI9360_03024 [Bacillus sp. CECT 9360]
MFVKNSLQAKDTRLADYISMIFYCLHSIKYNSKSSI